MEERDPVGSTLRLMLTMRHYYGDVVRMLFLVGTVIIFLGVPLTHALPASVLTVLVAATLVATFFAGLTNPRQVWVALCDAIIAAFAFAFFELLAIQAYNAAGTVLNPGFYVLQVLALDFLLAFYFAVKTVHGMEILDDLPAPPPQHHPPPSSTNGSFYN